MFKGLKPIVYHGREVWPLVEGGKGVSATNHASSGAWAAAGGIGTVSAVNADSYDPTGKIAPQVYDGKTRRERHEELIQFGIEGAVAQVKLAHEISSGKGAININVLWEMGGAQPILRGVLEQTKGLIHGVTCGAGMPYKLSEIAAEFGVSYLPIVSSGRAFRALWKRAYSKVPRVKALRDVMREAGIPDATPIVMAGGVWYLRDWNDWIDNPELGQIAFQFGTRPLLTQESPIPSGWKDRLMTLEEGDVLLHKFSPTGFYSSAVKTPFLLNLQARSDRQIAYGREQTETLTHELDVGVKGKNYWVSLADLKRAREWFGAGFAFALKTPADTLVFVTDAERKVIQKDQADCMGCLSHCGFSSWKDHDDYTTGYLADPRSFCIQKTLQDIAHGGDVDQNLMFAGHNAYNFKRDPFYSNGFVPTVKQLVDRILTGD
jgi:NAD(P)H-dependent flavin oxidoreductase YrpB (nitropropane dioxygenase family)